MHQAPTADFRIARRIALAGIAASAMLATINIAVGVLASSTAVLATGIEFAGDVLASTVVLFGMIAAVKPADQEHPYGHGRAETLAAFVVGMILAGGGVGICWNSLHAIGGKHPPPAAAAIVALLVAVVVRGIMSTAKFRIGRRIQSASLVADAWNDAVDILAAIAALVAVALAMLGGERFVAADHYGGFVVGIIVILTGGRVLRDASLELIDTMPDPEMIALVRATASGVPGVLAVEKAYARKTGFKYHVDLHIEVDRSLTVGESHAIAGQVRSRVRADIAWVADLLVHVEPAPAAATEGQAGGGFGATSN